ncbi:transmembrane protein fend-like isoform X2 [Calliphora vicina]|uniref:transmembrane protein fend-like isoform X2 n=1 Tax=Calliphora vicina TaxID=7373 RepID=UPI00325B9E70
MLCCKNINTQLMAFTAITLFGFISAQAVGSKDLFRCRQSCYQKFVQDWHHCMDFEDCKNCWNNCDQQLGPFPLNINSALRQGSLVITDIAWDQAITNASKQCLVTWEVSGGGLMGNLLTDSSTVELSLWSDTVYHVQVTCKHKETGGMRRSFKLIVDTHKLGDSSATGLQAIAMDSTFGSKNLPHIYGAESVPTSSGEADSRMRILKDSSKDFLTPYNPNVNTKTASTQTSSSIKVKTPNPAENEVVPSLNVKRTKLVGLPAVSESSTSFLTQSMVFAVVGSIVLFFGIIILYLIMRPTRKQISVIDKQMLIQTEVLPSQLPLNPASVHSAAKSSALNDQRATLHV